MKTNVSVWKLAGWLAVLLSAVSVAWAGEPDSGATERTTDDIYEDAQQAEGAARTALMEELRARAESGDALAWTLLGHCFRNGPGGEEAGNAREAFRCYRKASEAGNGWGSFWAGTACRTGTGTKQNDRAAIRWMRTAWNQGVTEAAFAISIGLFEDGNGWKPDEWNTRKLKSSADWALDGLQRAFQDAGKIYLENLVLRSRAGDGSAFVELLWRLFLRQGMENVPELNGWENFEDSLFWAWNAQFGKTSPKAWGSMKAAANMGGRFDPEFEKWIPEGLELPELTLGDLFEFTARQGVVSLDVMTLFGLFTPELLAIKELQAEQGDAEAALELGNFYENDGVYYADGLEEAKWRLMTKKDGHSQYRLGCLYNACETTGLMSAGSASWWFARCLETDKEDTAGANNALLLMWLSGKSVWQPPAADAPENGFRLVRPENEGWAETGEVLATRAAQAAEEGESDFFAPSLLAMKAFGEGDSDGARHWVEKLPEELSAPVLASWDALAGVNGEPAEQDLFVRGLRKFFGTDGIPDWLEAYADFMAAFAKGNGDAARFAYLLLDCNWWGWRQPPLALPLAQERAKAGDSWMAREVVAHISQEQFNAGRFAELRETIMPWVELADDPEFAERMSKGCDLLERMHHRTQELLAGPCDAENVSEWMTLCDKVNRGIRDLAEEMKGSAAAAAPDAGSLSPDTDTPHDHAGEELSGTPATEEDGGTAADP